MKNKIDYITLYHYTDKDISGKLSPAYFGENVYTGFSNRLSSIKRLYFYTKAEPETLLKNSRFLYTAKIAEKKIYNIIEDKNGYNTGKYTFNEIINKVKALNYTGIFGNVGGRYEVIFLFKSIKPYKKEVLPC